MPNHVTTESTYVATCNIQTMHSNNAIQMEEVTESVCPFSSSCLGMCSWTDCPGGVDRVNSETGPHPETELQLLPSASCSNSSKIEVHPSPSQGRFEFASENQLQELAKGHIPQNTSYSTQWALTTFHSWSQARNKSYPEDPVPEDLFSKANPQELTKHCLLYTSPSPRDATLSRMPSSA